jgi:hypothetical protein
MHPLTRIPGLFLISGALSFLKAVEASGGTYNVMFSIYVSRTLSNSIGFRNKLPPFLCPLNRLVLVAKFMVKTNLFLCFNRAPRHESVLGEWGYSSTHFLTSVLDGDEWSASSPGHFTPREKAPFTNWIGGWVGPRADLDLNILYMFLSFRGD